MTPKRQFVAVVCLGLGMLCAGVLAALETTRLSPQHAALPDGVAARVGEFTITDDELERALAALAADRREGPRSGDRAYVLERLIDETLLIQHALAQGLAHHDPRTRADLTAAALRLLSSEAELRDPSEDELQTLYLERQAELGGASEVRVEHRFGVVQRARDGQDSEAAERSGTSEAWLLALRETATEDLQPPPLPLPHGWLGERELQGSFGPTFARQILAAEAGEWVGPLDRDGGVHLVRVVATRAANAPPLDDVRRVLVSLWRRERGDRAVRAFLNAARRDTLIRTQEPARP